MSESCAAVLPGHRRHQERQYALVEPAVRRSALLCRVGTDIHGAVSRSADSSLQLEGGAWLFPSDRRPDRANDSATATSRRLAARVPFGVALISSKWSTTRSWSSAGSSAGRSLRSGYTRIS